MTAVAVGGSNASGLKWPNYVNGRLLTAGDLEAMQAAVFTRDRWLGLAVGSGVVEGFEVTGVPGGTKLAVERGVGVNREGAAMCLEAKATLELAVVQQSALPDGSRFEDCRPTTVATKAPTAGAYLLTACPQTWFDGKVPVQGREGPLTTPCVSRWEVEGVVFKVIRLDSFAEKTNASNRRNVLAHWCFGSSQLGPLAMAAFPSTPPYREIDRLPAADLSDCDLPLAVFVWTGSALEFVDQWSARRRPVRPAATHPLLAVVGDERTADGEARFLQFQAHLAWQLGAGGPSVNMTTAAPTTLVANSVFPRLPPAGILPISTNAAIKMLKGMFDEGITVSIAQPAVAEKADDDAERVGRWDDELKFLDEEVDFGALKWTKGQLGGVATEFFRLQQKIDALEAAFEGMKPPAGDDEEVEAAPSAAKVDRAKKLMDLMGLFIFTGTRGVALGQFFAGMDVRLGVITKDAVDFAIRRSWYDEAIRVGSNPTVNVYFVVDDDWGAVAPYVLFAKHIAGAEWLTDTAGPLPT